MFLALVTWELNLQCACVHVAFLVPSQVTRSCEQFVTDVTRERSSRGVRLFMHTKGACIME